MACKRSQPAGRKAFTLTAETPLCSATAAMSLSRTELWPSQTFDKSQSWSWEIAHWVKALAPKPSSPSSIPGTHMMEEEHQLPQVVLWPPLVHRGMCAHARARARTHTHMKQTNRCNLQKESYPPPELNTLISLLSPSPHGIKLLRQNRKGSILLGHCWSF